MKKAASLCRPRRRTAAQNRAQFNRAARDARERVGTISVRVWRGKWICPRESSATSGALWWMGRRPRVDDEASNRPFFETRDHLSLMRPFVSLGKRLDD